MRLAGLINQEVTLKKLRNFKCETGVIFERLVEDTRLKATCLCGCVALKTISAARYMGNTVGKSPSAR